ncbi:hypothetical protein [Clostridium sp. AM58-1XD]|uniref:hypothetical protein n=1 Tax=Clostridium sp. AM58-1XD TaxID=2292307 RepID=UPI000E4DCC85|nr:hypothetical protein [Clostridium sp. AM58-1XD]RGZ01884.1 hypothetical protein DXA13_00855 [Clostridium sp. AM58-1XD]
MIQWFTRKKNGAISIMLAIILIPMLAFGSVLMEAARIHSARAILSEIADNGLYSMLAFYDPDLLSRFGLLAMDPDVSIDEMDKYMMETANEYLQDPKNIEKLLSIQESGIEAEKLFALNDRDVLERQIMEYTKYRGPVDLAASALDLDKIIKELETTIQNALPILNQMQAAARAIESTVNTIYSVVDYSEKAGKFKGLIDTYNTAYEEYYSGLDGLITFMQENDPEDSKPEPPEKPDHMTDDEKEAYKEEVEAYKEAKKEYEESVKEYKKELKEYKETFGDAKTSYMQAIKGLKGGMGAYKTAHEAVKTALSSYKNILPDYKQQMDQYSINKTTMTDDEKRKFNKISGAIQDTHRKYEAPGTTCHSISQRKIRIFTQAMRMTWMMSTVV